MENGKNKREYITLLNVIATFAVVMWHINEGIYSVGRSASWLISIFIDTLVFFSVPSFFAISGANLIGYNDRGETTGKYFLKRIKKTFIPFVFWSLIFVVIYGRADLKPFFSSRDWLGFIKYLLASIFYYKYCLVYWFFIDLFIVYLLIPLISLVPKDKKIRVYSIAVPILLVLLYVPDALEKLFGIVLPFTLKGRRYFIFAVSGFLIKNTELSKKQRHVSYILFVFALLMHFFGTIKVSLDAGLLDSSFREKDGILCWFMACGALIYSKYEGEKIMNGRIGKAVNIISGYTFGIYLLHILMLKSILPKIGVDLYSTETNHVIAMPVAFVLAIVFSIAATYIIRKIPVLKKTIPK